ncbi:MobF family relaxase [Nonomuraea typhae]|uniref:MobF family relaxase n=1 Tax=Nonomuraea typhae TaxID=2603600 RepID=UPI0012FCA9A3|nr:MobF family relaxase [Nonomuraea typhae]
MAWVSVIGPSMEQVDYRLQEGAGCGMGQPGEPAHEHGPARGEDGQVAYRLADERGLMWIGEGLREVGLTPGTRLTADQHEAARAIMSGVDPRTGEVLLAAKHLADPRAKLPGAPLVAALEAAAAAQGVTVEKLLAARPAMAKRAAQLARGVDRQGETHLIRIDDVEKLARAADVDLAAVYEPKELAYARKWREARVRVGNRGYDLTLDLSKSVSVLYGLADAEFAAAIENVFADAVTETVAAMEKWAAYGQRGHQGDGQLAERMDSTGLLGWVMWHKTARPVDGQAPDPHLHAHVAIANLVRGREDGRWSAIGAGGRDIHRHAHAADALLKARIRRVLTERYGIAFGRDPVTGAWEIIAIPEATRVLLSKRAGQVEGLLARLGVDPASASRQAVKTASAESRQAKGAEPDEAALRAAWHQQVDDAAGEPGHGQALAERCRTGHAVLPERPSTEEIAAWIWRPEHGLTSHTKIVSRADVLAAVIDALPDGVADLAEAEALTDEVLQHGPAVQLADAGASHLTNAQRFTSRDILDAEETILAQVRDRYATGVAVVDGAAAALAIDTYQVANGFEFSPAQREVLERLLTAGHGIDAVIGVAGAGKTTIMAAARSGWEARGLVVRGAATAAVAAANLQAESGIGADTIATWLQRIDGGQGLAGVDVLVVDEAAMVDDRHLATLLTEAMRCGTKVVPIGDPLQLRAIGVGGGFRAVHRQVDGLTLRENRRQKDPVERAALELWRGDNRRQALRAWGEGGRVHAGLGAEDTMAQLVSDWAAARAPYRDSASPEAVHDELAGVLVLAGTNDAAERLNQAARAIRREAGEITGPERRYAVAGGKHIVLAVGDHVRVRKNDYRARRGEGDVDILNGYRGRVTEIDERGRVRVEWRAVGPEGPRIRHALINPADIAEGMLSYGTAMTVAAAQGLTSDHALIYGMGLDPHTLYAAMTRDRLTAHLYLPRDLLETDADRAAHGPVRGEADALQRALAAYAQSLEGDRADRLITPEPDPIAHDGQGAEPDRPAERATGRQADRHRDDVDQRAEHDANREHQADRDTGRDDREAGDPGRERAADVDQAVDRRGQADVERAADPDAEREHQAAAELATAEEALATVRRANALMALSGTPFGVGLLDDTALAARQKQLAQQATAAAAKLQRAEQIMRRYISDGGGPAEKALEAKRAQLAAQAREIETARQAAEQLRQARRQVTEGNRAVDQIHKRERAIAAELAKLGKILPSHRARRRELEAELPHLAERRAAIAEHLAPVREEGPAIQEHARQAAAQAPPAATWSLISRQHDDLERGWESARSQARTTDVTVADGHSTAARQTYQRARQQLAATREETERRADLPPDVRAVERQARAEYAERERQAAERGERPERRPRFRSQGRDRDRDDAYRPPPARDRGGPERGR